MQTLAACGIDEDTIVLFTSDHGDMLGSHGRYKKQQPWDEAIRVPFLLRYPALLGTEGRTLDALIDAPDIMPTLLGLCGLPIPESVEGLDYAGYVQGGSSPGDGSALLMCPQPFGQWSAPRHGGMAYRGLRTARYTYTRTLDGPWLLFDNAQDPYQMENLVGGPAYAGLVRELDAWLQRRLDARGDAFLPGMAYIQQWGYPVDETGTVPYTW